MIQNLNDVLIVHIGDSGITALIKANKFVDYKNIMLYL